MVCKINCAAITGIDVVPVSVETDICNGLPSFDMVGLLGSDTKESRERVRTAIKNSGFMLPPKRITINFSPGHIRKGGTYFDMAVAISILQALDFIKEDMSDKIFIGELSLNGDVVKVNGVLPIVLSALNQGIKQCFVPTDNVRECESVQGIRVIGVDNLNQLVMILQGAPVKERVHYKGSYKKDKYKYDFAHIKGQLQAKKAAEIAAAGMHNLLMVGPPGTGKSVIAKAMPSILPDMSRQEALEVSRIHSVAGKLKDGLITERPIRSPHHTATVAAMIGGGINPKPGEVTLAHGGVLYMDEFPEFSRAVIETLRQPLEDRVVELSRMGGCYLFPADFILLAAMNPCRCGFYPDRNKCNCTDYDVKKYTEKVSGPIMDRIELTVRLNSVSLDELREKETSEDSATIRRRVVKAVQIQKKRYRGEEFNFNSRLKGRDIAKYCILDKDADRLAGQIYDKFNMSVRAYENILKVARTIADLKGHDLIGSEEIAESLSFRNMEL